MAKDSFHGYAINIVIFCRYIFYVLQILTSHCGFNFLEENKRYILTLKNACIKALIMLMRITALGQKLTHRDHNHQVLLSIPTSLARCMGTMQVIHSGIFFGATNLQIAVTEWLTALACFFLSAEVSAPKDLSPGQINAR